MLASKLKRAPKALRMIAKVLLGLIVILAIFAIYQFIMYRIEGGVFVADGYTDPPVSTAIYYRGRPLSKAVVATKRIGTIDSSGERTYYFESFMDWQLKWAYWNALRKFPTLEKCLLLEGQKTMDLSKFSWGSMRTNTQVEVCLYHVSAELQEPNALKKWAIAQGFQVKLYNTDSLNIIKARWRKEKLNMSTPYPLFSEQTIEQYGLVSLLFGLIGNPNWAVQINENGQVIDVEIRNLASK